MATDQAQRKFERESSLVELLMRRLGVSVEAYINPDNATDETGADVLAVVAGRRIGIQVTELDTGAKPGRSRACELRTKRDAEAKGLSTYGAWVQNDPRALLATIGRAVASKVQHVTGCKEAWLLISANVSELGSIVSTFVISQSLNANALGSVTSHHLARCKYDHAFLHLIVSNEGALYHWTADGSWQKLTQPQPNDGPSFWDVQKLMRAKW